LPVPSGASIDGMQFCSSSKILLLIVSHIIRWSVVMVLSPRITKSCSSAMLYDILYSISLQRIAAHVVHLQGIGRWNLSKVTPLIWQTKSSIRMRSSLYISLVEFCIKFWSGVRFRVWLNISSVISLL
jgi:hypothetical protein